MRGHLGAVFLVLGLTLAGCLGPRGDDTPPPSGDATTLPPGCDATRAAVAHHAGGVPADAVGPLPVPCFLRTGSPSLEPTMGVTSSGAVFVYPASDATLGNVGSQPVSGAVAHDDGATWESLVPDVAGQPAHPASLDPYMFVDAATDRVFFDDIVTTACSVLSWSDDEGGAWESSASGCMEFDHQTLFAGPPVTSTTLGYPNIVYRCAINLVAAAESSTAATCQRSLDGGRTWLLPGEPAFVTRPGGAGHQGMPWCDGATGHGVTDAEGRVYLPKGLCGQPWLAVSDDEGLTWSRVQVANNGMRTDEDGFQAHEAGVAVDAAGNVYYVWVALDRLPYLAVSRDRGATWSEPAMVGVPGLVQASLPAVAAGSEGRIAVAYMGSTNAPEGPWETCTDVAPACAGAAEAYRDVTWNGYLGVTVNALEATPTWYSSAVNPPEAPLVVGRCGGLRCQEVFDFIDVVVAPDGTPWAPYVDGCSSSFTTCEPDDGELGEGVVGRLWGGPGLWDAAG